MWVDDSGLRLLFFYLTFVRALSLHSHLCHAILAHTFGCCCLIVHIYLWALYKCWQRSFLYVRHPGTLNSGPRAGATHSLTLPRKFNPVELTNISFEEKKMPTSFSQKCIGLSGNCLVLFVCIFTSCISITCATCMAFVA